MALRFDSYMLKEANDPTRQANQRARTDADGPPLLAVDNRLVIPAGKVVKFIITADDVIHSFAMPAFWIKQDANPGPAPRDLGQGRPPGRLFRSVLGAVRRAPRLHADRDRSRPAGAVRRLGRLRRAATCPARSRRLPRRRGDGNAARQCRRRSRHAGAAAIQQPATNPGRDRAELRAKRTLSMSTTADSLHLQAARGA